MTKYILVQPTELEVFTINDFDGELAVYIVLNDTKKRTRWVSQDFKENQFYEKTESKSNAMKSRFKTNKLLSPIKETDHILTTADGKVIHKKLASNPLKVQPTKRSEETRKSTNRCRRCGRFSHHDCCETHKGLWCKAQTRPNNKPRIIQAKFSPKCR